MNRPSPLIMFIQASVGFVVIWLLFGFNVTNAATPDRPATNRMPASKGRVVYEKKTTIDFDGAPVGSEFRSPEGMAVKGDQNLDFDSLLAPKNDFAKELNRGARAVR